ncbi:hypothetical protein Tco_0091204 [Tanacetum coccineum]
MRNRQTLQTLLQQNPTSYKIQFAPSTKKGAGEFVAKDILDIETTVETHTTGTGTILATGLATSSKKSTSIDKGTSGTVLATHPTKGTNKPINEKTQTPGKDKKDKKKKNQSKTDKKRKSQEKE